MDFGIMTLQLSSLLPAAASAVEMMGSLAGFDHARLVKSLFDQGFNPIELSGDLNLFLPQAYSPEAIINLAALKEQGLRYSVHIPLWSLELATPLAPVREGSTQAVIDCIRATWPLEPEAYVLHATGPLAAEFYNMKLPEMAHGLLLRQFQTAAKTSITEILKETGIPSRKIAIETIEFPLDLTLEMAEELDLSVCLDVGHVLAGFCGWYDFWEVFDKILPRLAEVHLHDCKQMPEGIRGYGEDHHALGTGDLDVVQLLERLEKNNFQRPIIFELTVLEALASIKRIKEIAPQYLA